MVLHRKKPEAPTTLSGGIASTRGIRRKKTGVPDDTGAFLSNWIERELFFQKTGGTHQFYLVVLLT